MSCRKALLMEKGTTLLDRWLVALRKLVPLRMDLYPPGKLMDGTVLSVAIEINESETAVDTATVRPYFVLALFSILKCGLFSVPFVFCNEVSLSFDPAEKG